MLRRKRLNAINVEGSEFEQFEELILTDPNDNEVVNNGEAAIDDGQNPQEQTIWLEDALLEEEQVNKSKTIFPEAAQTEVVYYEEDYGQPTSAQTPIIECEALINRLKKLLLNSMGTSKEARAKELLEQALEKCDHDEHKSCLGECEFNIEATSI